MNKHIFFLRKKKVTYQKIIGGISMALIEVIHLKVISQMIINHHLTPVRLMI